jgi:hypothetical protein
MTTHGSLSRMRVLPMTFGSLLPKAVIEHYHLVPAVLVFIRQEGPAKHRLRALQLEPVRSSARSLQLLRFT